MRSNIIILLLMMFIPQLIHNINTLFQSTEVTPDYFLDNFLKNTSRLDIYSNNLTDIYLINQTTSNHFINITDSPKFEYKVKRSREKIEINHLLEKKTQNNWMSFIILGIIGYAFIHINNKNSSKHINIDAKSDVKIKDVAGLEYAKEEVLEFVDFLKNRNKYLDMGAKMPRGALFYGPPGTGKTLLAKAIAGECGVPFISASGSDFVEVYVGVGASRIRNLFQKARDKAPCVLFIDEIDALARKRANGFSSGGDSERDSTLNKFLVELDGFESNENILVFGATNRLDVLDNALLRPGRFDRKIMFELPEKNDRKEIFQHYLSKLDLDKEPEEIATNLSKLSFGFSGADIANICNEACILAVRNNLEVITEQVLKDAIDHVILGPEKKTFRLSDNERRTVAYHEAGHTVMAYFLENTTKPIKVSIMPRGKSALGFSQRELPENKLRTKEELLDDICVLLGGRIAEEIYIGQITTGASDDIQKLTQLGYSYVSIYGMDDEISTINYQSDIEYSQDTRNRIDLAVKQIVNRCYHKTKNMLELYNHHVKTIAEDLLEKETLYEEDLDKIFQENKVKSYPILSILNNITW